jgi:hypothetical protein
MYDLGYINEVTNMMTYKQFACKNVMLANLTFDNVLQIVFPSLSGAQRKILASKVKPPEKVFVFLLLLLNVFPSLSGAQREFLASKVKPPAKVFLL